MFAQLIGQLLATHHDQGSLQVFGDSRFVAATLQATGLQPPQVRRDRQADVFVVTGLRTRFVRLVSKKLVQQRPALLRRADQHVVNINAGRAAAGFKAICRTPLCMAGINIELAITVAPQFIE
ncbi:hypothetical protein D3C76_1413730 [compost metagenome]